jgi:hypothetical protein
LFIAQEVAKKVIDPLLPSCDECLKILGISGAVYDAFRDKLANIITGLVDPQLPVSIPSLPCPPSTVALGSRSLSCLTTPSQEAFSVYLAGDDSGDSSLTFLDVSPTQSAQSVTFSARSSVLWSRPFS